MAATQRKLVHKQFNSPMGLYSAQNVKETLHRELKAFGGDGIEVDESLLKPSNLANSAVLKALEEEENEQYGVHHKQRYQQETNKNTRESRPRQRIIVDRDTVLKINRRGSRHRSHDHSWPPPQLSAKDRSRSASDEKVCKQHRIDSIARKFDHGQQDEEEVTHHKSSDSLDGDMSRRINERSRTAEWPPMEQRHLESRSTNQTFCLPDDVEHMHIGIVQPRRQYFEEIAESNEDSPKTGKQWGSSESLYQPTKPASHFISRPQTASLDRYSCKRQLPPMKPRSRTLSRPRNKSPMRREIKSKSPTDIATTIWLSSSASQAERSSCKLVTIQLPAKVGGKQDNNQINYDAIAMNNNRDHNNTARPAKPAAPRIIDCSRKNSTKPAHGHAVSSSPSSSPLSCRSSTTERNLNNDKRQQEQQHLYPSTKNYDGNLTTSTDAANARPIGNGTGHKVKLNRRNHTSARPQLNANPNSKSTAERKSDTGDAKDTDTCIRSIDLIDATTPTTQNPAQVVQSSTHTDNDEKLRYKQGNIAQPPQDDNKTVTRNENKFQKDTTSKSRTTNGDKYHGDDGKDTAPTVDSNSNKSLSECETKHERRKGIYYTDGEYLFGPFDTAAKDTVIHEDAVNQTKVTVIPIEVEKTSSDTVTHGDAAKEQRKPKVTVIPIEVEKSSSDGIEISSLEQKCGKIQKSITEDLRQIDRYMMQAKMALNRLQQEHQIVLQQPVVEETLPKVMIVEETPLQAMIRRIFRKMRSPSPCPTIVSINAGGDDRIYDFMNPSISQVENVPVVEQALLDLSNLAAVLADDDNRRGTLIASNRVMSPVMFTTPLREPPPPQRILVDITEVDSRSHSSLSEGTANSPCTVTDSGTEESHSAANQPRHEDEIILSKNILSGYIITKKDQEELLEKASTRPQTKIIDSTIVESPTLNPNRGQKVYGVENVTGHSKTDAGRWQLAFGTKPCRQEDEQNSINNIKYTQSNITSTPTRDAPPPPPPPPPPPSLGNNLKYHVNGLYGHDVGLVTITPTANDDPCRPGRARNRKSDINEGTNKVRSLSQPPPFEYLMESVPSLQSMTTSTIDLVGAFADDSRNNNVADGGCSDVVNRRDNNVSPCLYFPGSFHATTGYKRVAWPPVSEGRTIREFTPQPSPQPPYQQPQQQQQQQQQQAQQQPNYQRPGASPVQAANQGDHYIQSQPNYQSSYPNQQQQQQPLRQPSPQRHNPQEPYYPQHQAVPGKPFSYTPHGVGGAVNNTPRPNPQPQYQYPPQSPPQQQQQLYQPPPSPEPQQQYQQQQQQQYQPQTNYPQQGGHQQLDEPPRGRWGHVASPIPQRTGYVQNYQQPQASPAAQPPFSSEPQYGSQQQQNLYGAPSVPQVNQSYDRQPSYGPPQQQQFAPAPIAPATAAPQQYYQAHQQPQPQQYNQTSQPIDNQYNYYSQPEPQQQQHQQLQQQQYRGESPGIITLRKEAPITQQPAPVYTSQPATASYGGGSTMRGDLKWPPPEYKEQAVVENEERRRVAQGPVCRPRRINKDYTQFFAKNALSHHYPSYKVPPGTQHIYGTY